MIRPNRYNGHLENSGEVKLIQEYKEKLSSIAAVIETQKTATKLLFHLDISPLNISNQVWSVARSLSGSVKIEEENQVWVVCDRPRAIPLGLKGIFIIMTALVLIKIIYQIRVWTDPLIDLVFA